VTRKRLAGVLAACCLAVGLIAARYRGGMRHARFGSEVANQIKPGMTLDAVERVLGGPPGNYGSAPFPSEGSLIFSASPGDLVWDDGQSKIMVTLTGNRVKYLCNSYFATDWRSRLLGIEFRLRSLWFTVHHPRLSCRPIDRSIAAPARDSHPRIQKELAGILVVAHVEPLGGRHCLGQRNRDDVVAL
jgi:hypothetical protein